VLCRLLYTVAHLSASDLPAISVLCTSSIHSIVAGDTRGSRIDYALFVSTSPLEM
jgi:hypothetical protein